MVDMVMPQVMFLLPFCTETGHFFQIADHPCCMIDINRVTLAAIMQCLLVDMMAVIANGNADIKTEIIASCLSRGMNELDESIAVWGLFQIQVQG